MGLLTGQSFYECTSSRSSRITGFSSPTKDFDPPSSLPSPFLFAIATASGVREEVLLPRFFVCSHVQVVFLFPLHASGVAYSVAPWDS